jgi:hypothetical protein
VGAGRDDIEEGANQPLLLAFQWPMLFERIDNFMMRSWTATIPEYPKDKFLGKAMS